MTYDPQKMGDSFYELTGFFRKKSIFRSGPGDFKSASLVPANFRRPEEASTGIRGGFSVWLAATEELGLRPVGADFFLKRALAPKDIPVSR